MLFELAVLLVRLLKELETKMPTLLFELAVLLVRVLFEPASTRMPPPPWLPPPTFKVTVLESRVLSLHDASKMPWLKFVTMQFLTVTPLWPEFSIPPYPAAAMSAGIVPEFVIVCPAPSRVILSAPIVMAVPLQTISESKVVSVVMVLPQGGLADIARGVMNRKRGNARDASKEIGINLCELAFISGRAVIFVFIFCRGWIFLTALTAIQFRAEPGGIVLHLTILLRELVDEVSADSGLQLDLEIALSGVSAKVQPHEYFLARPKMR